MGGADARKLSVPPCCIISKGSFLGLQAAAHIISAGGQELRGSGSGWCMPVLVSVSVLQDYQADLFKELDERKAMSSDDITELRRTKETAHAIGHLWLTLSDIREKNKRWCFRGSCLVAL